MDKTQPSLPANRAFVVQIHRDARVKNSEFKGRVEHIVSYQATHFESLEELAAFIVRVVRRNKSREERAPPEENELRTVRKRER
jgi:hypothetical protein